ncbi:hypothetical protein FisN_13Lh386 [Fistulifera solaris]|uniref:BRO1 domain-containing protein n=1 Tax=Fistulifera solaris TaxID=1519565 RepID=A0A1Z5JA61_FISSO|nr:hypothetical protein FisN_13Lh386 [Fistulifera solaris]|eukprot:GAX10782.1 hypothetical protein FisN_13Lh386 [Fistulifera solaris]
MSDYLYKDPEKTKTDHPDSAIRLAAVVHRFRVPQPTTRKVSFFDAFYTTGKDAKTRRHMKQADEARRLLHEACCASKVSAERVMECAQRYEPLINTILLSCQIQPEQARLDEKLVFEWVSGVEASTQAQAFASEAILYDLCMTVATTGLGQALLATENSIAGDFAASSRAYAIAAGVWAFLSDDLLPKWIAKGSSVDATKLPSECHGAMAKALCLLFQTNGQQMAVATLLMKPGTPNYSLLAKLCLGVQQQLDGFIALLRREAFDSMQRLDKDFMTLVALQIAVHEGLTLYFQARACWENQEYGLAIAFLSEAGIAMKTRSSIASRGVPDVNRVVALKAIQPDLEGFRNHIQFLLSCWEHDNQSVFFEAVPQSVPSGKKLADGHCMNKKTLFELQPIEPVLLKLPDGALQRSDSDLARELQEQLNFGRN